MSPRKPESDFSAQAFRQHDHGECVRSLMDAARDLCAKRELRLTPVREKVLELLLKSHAPLGAYVILSELAAAGFRAQPPVAYRALDFLVENGLVHRIEKINAFVACSQPREQQRPQEWHAPLCTCCTAIDEWLRCGAGLFRRRTQRQRTRRQGRPAEAANRSCIWAALASPT